MPVQIGTGGRSGADHVAVGRIGNAAEDKRHVTSDMFAGLPKFSHAGLPFTARNSANCFCGTGAGVGSGTGSVSGTGVTDSFGTALGARITAGISVVGSKSSTERFSLVVRKVTNDSVLPRSARPCHSAGMQSRSNLIACPRRADRLGHASRDRAEITRHHGVLPKRQTALGVVTGEFGGVGGTQAQKGDRHPEHSGNLPGHVVKRELGMDVGQLVVELMHLDVGVVEKQHVAGISSPAVPASSRCSAAHPSAAWSASSRR